MAHLGGIISRGPGLSIVESTAVVAEGRITPEDSGIWQDSQIEGLSKITEFAHSQGQKIAIQLGHAGRKASTVAPWLSMGAAATEEVNGWPSNVFGPSNIPYNEDHCTPHTLTLSQIDDLKTAWVAAVKRALKAGFDAVEIHNAHGYLLHSFLSPVSNTRTDAYGGSFENRTRLTLEIVELARAAIPDSMPLLLRISASDWLDNNPDFQDPSWTLADTVKLAPLLAERGVDLLDVSSGGTHPAQKIVPGPGYQAPFAKAIKKALGPNSSMKVSTVGSITSGLQAEALLTGKGEGAQGEEELDFVAVGRMFQKNPGLVWTWAEELETRIKVANQIGWGFGGRAGGPKKG
jgi:2,4-dienoyl-CoA reductase-like NADH-dependent reductase (Old Yellow Enzyme family)